MPDAGSAPDPREKALRLLARREHARSELRRKLIQAGCDREAVEAVLDELARSGLQSDLRYAEARARNRCGQGKGPHWVRQELGQLQLGDEIIESALAQDEIDWAEGARLALAKLARRHSDPYKLRQKLVERGFDSRLARDVVDAM